MLQLKLVTTDIAGDGRLRERNVTWVREKPKGLSGLCKSCNGKLRIAGLLLCQRSMANELSCLCKNGDGKCRKAGLLLHHACDRASLMPKKLSTLNARTVKANAEKKVFSLACERAISS